MQISLSFFLFDVINLDSVRFMSLPKFVTFCDNFLVHFIAFIVPFSFFRTLKMQVYGALRILFYIVFSFFLHIM